MIPGTYTPGGRERTRRFGVLCVLLLALVALGQGALAGERAYEVGPGDVLEVRVWQEPDLSGRFSVEPRGHILAPLIGEFSVAGKGVQEIRESLVEAYGADYLVNPVITVSVAEYRSHKVFLLGRVAQPGTYYLKEDPSFLRVLLDAGGPSGMNAGVATVLRFENSESGGQLAHLRVNLNQLFVGGDLTQDIDLRAQDIVFVSSAGAETDVIGNEVFVVGEVGKPGKYRWYDGYTALNAVLDAGGLTDFAAGNRARLIRGEGEGREVIRIELGSLLEGQLEKNIILKPGDLISVPESFF